jgi:predicted TIM-barrel fold metal-dependent hydrolase
MEKAYKIVNTHGHLHAGDDVVRLVDEWRAEGVVRFCALALDTRFQAHGYLGNEGVKQWMDRYPDIIAGVGSIDAGVKPDPAGKVDELRADGFQGLKFISPARAYSDDCYFGYYERAEELGMPIIFHTGIVSSMAGDGQPEYNVDAENMRPYRFDRISRRFPELMIIGAHLGLPHENEAIRVAMEHRNVYYDFCGAGGSKARVSELKKLLAPFPGANWDDPDENVAKRYFKKFVFATDNPPVSVWKRNALELMDYLHIDEETRQDFFWRNAARLFGWKELLDDE